LVEEEPILKTMPKKLKITLGVLLLVAGFLLVRIGLYFKNSATGIGSSAVRGVSQLSEEENRLTADSDQDGIADVDESYYRTDAFDADSDDDGYLDGEEVITGHLPTVKDTGEISDEQSLNVTNNLTQRLVGGIYAGDLNPRNGRGQKYAEGMNYLALATIDEALGKINQIPKNSSVLITNDSVASQEEYLKKIADILDGPFLNAFLQQPQTLHATLTLAVNGQFEEANQSFTDYNIKFTNAYAKLLAIPAPGNWIDFHKHLLIFFQKIATEYNYATQWQDDPMLALTAISDLARSLGNIDTSLLQELRSLIQKNNLKVPDSQLFEVLGLLNSGSIQ